MNLRNLTLAIALGALSTGAFAQSMTFKVGTGSPAAQLAQVESDTDFETFTGTTANVKGMLMFDPKAKTGRADITVDVASIKTGIDLRDEHMRSADWLDAGKHPSIIFKSTSIKARKDGKYIIAGQITMKGVTKTITTIATVVHRKESEATKAARFKGDVLRVQTSFNLKLADFGVKIPAQAKGKVAESVKITVTLYGQSG